MSCATSCESAIKSDARALGYQAIPSGDRPMRRSNSLVATSIGALAALAQIVPANAVEIKIMAPRAIWTILNEAGPQFERTTGHKLNVSVDLAAVVVRRVNSGEPFDIAVATPAQIDALVKDGKLIADTR